MKYVFPLILTALLIAACIPLTHCSDDGPVAPPDTTKPPPPRDTTSHEFTWALHKVGADHGQMKDIWAINDDYAIAVGEFIRLDSGGGYSSTNAVVLDGGKLTRFNASSDGRFSMLYSCYGSDVDKFWFGDGTPFQWFDSVYKRYIPTDIQRPPWGGHVTKMWSRKNSEDLYLTCGNVIQRVKDGWIKTILKPEDHPEIAFYRIWGEEDGDVYAIGNDKSVLTCYLYRIKPDNTWEILRESPSYMYGLWCYNGSMYFTDYGDVIRWDGKEFRWLLYDPEELSILSEIDGNHENDIFLVDQYGKVLHWNGSTWEIIYDGGFGTMNLPALSVTANTVYVSGVLQPGQQPAILVGKRHE